MEHGGFVEESLVSPQFGMAVCHIEGHVSHATAVCQQDLTQRGIVAVVFIYQLVNHIFLPF